MPPATGIVVPAYHPDVSVLLEHIRGLRRTVDPETIVVALDDPRPGVPARVRESGATVDVSPTRRGKGTAISQGFDRLDTPWLAFSDADGSTPATSVADVVAALDDADIAVGSRRHPDAVVETHQSHLRRYLGDAFAAAAARVLAVDLHDFQCGAKAMTATTWRHVRPHIRESGFGWDIEVLAVADSLDCSIVEVPVRWRDRPRSSVPPVRTAVELARVVVSARRRRPGLGRGVESVPVGESEASTQLRSDGAGK